MFQHALKLPFRGGSVRDLANEALKIAAHGLQRRARLSPGGVDERMFLDALLQIVDANQTPAERKLELFHGEWNGDIDRVFREFAYCRLIATQSRLSPAAVILSRVLAHVDGCAAGVVVEALDLLHRFNA